MVMLLVYILVYILVHVLLVYNKRFFLCELIGLVMIYESVPLQLVETAWPPTCLGTQRPSKGGDYYIIISSWFRIKSRKYCFIEEIQKIQL